MFGCGRRFAGDQGQGDFLRPCSDLRNKSLRFSIVPWVGKAIRLLAARAMLAYFVGKFRMAEWHEWMLGITNCGFWHLGD